MCNTCLEQRHNPAVAQIHLWDWLDRPWTWLHGDYVGPFMGRMFFILTDAHSKWMDAYSVSSLTSNNTIDCQGISFSKHGLPELIASDTGTCFKSEKFEDFLKRNGILHVTSAPYQTSSNVLAERVVKTFKDMLRKCPEGSLKAKVARILFSYRQAYLQQRRRMAE